MFSKTRKENKHQAQGRISCLFLYKLPDFWEPQSLGYMFPGQRNIRKQHSLPSPRVTKRHPSRRLLRAGASSFLSLQLPSLSLPPSTSRSPCWQGAGVNSWSLPLERSAQLARLWPSFTAGTDKAHMQVSWYRSIYVAKNAYKAAIRQVLRRCWVREHHEGDCSGRHQGLAADHDSKSKSEKPYWHNAWTKDNRRLDYFAKVMLSDCLNQPWVFLMPSGFSDFFPFVQISKFPLFVQTSSRRECFNC